jgi:hypothetical protein
VLELNKSHGLINISHQSRVDVGQCCGSCQPQHIEQKMLSHIHFAEQVEQIFIDLHSKHVVQYVDGDALTAQILPPNLVCEPLPESTKSKIGCKLFPHPYTQPKSTNSRIGCKLFPHRHPG